MKKITEKYKNVPIAVKATFWFVFASMLQKGMAFITVPIFTRVMDTEQYGTYSTYLSWTAIMTVLLTLRLESGAYSNILGKDKNQERQQEITLSFVSLCFCINTCAMILLLAFPDFFVQITGLSFLMLVFMLLEIYFIPIVNYWTFQQRFEYKYRNMVCYTIFKSIANVVIGLVLVCLFPINLQAYGRIISVVAVECVMGAGLYFCLVKKTKKFFVIKEWNETLKFQLPLIPHYLSMNILFSSDRIMISKLVGKAEAGIYNVAYSAGQIMDVLKTCVVDAIRPWMYERLNHHQYKEINKITTLLIGVMTVVSFGYALIAPEMIRILAAPQYYSAVYVVPPVAMSSIFTFEYHFLMIVETYYGKTTKIMNASVLAALANIILNYFLIPQWGFVVAGYTTMISYLVLSLFHYRTVYQIEKDELEGVRLFDVKSILIISLIGAMACLGVSLLYDMFLIRYCIILILCVGMFLSRKKIIKFYKMIKRK